MRCSTSASRSPARLPTASRRSRSTAPRVARTSCSSSGASGGTTRSASSASRSCRTCGRDRADAGGGEVAHQALLARGGGTGGGRADRRSALGRRAPGPGHRPGLGPRSALRARVALRPGLGVREPAPRPAPADPALRARLLVESRCGVARRPRSRGRERRRGRLRSMVRGAAARLRRARAEGRSARNGRPGVTATVAVDRERLVETASAMIDVHSVTGDEQRMAELMVSLYEQLGLQVQWQQVEDGRADVPGFQPQAFVRDGRLYGLGISNMKGALACYVEAVRALQEAGVRLRGDVLVAAVCGEIEKTQYGDAQGAEYRGYAAGTRYLVSHGGVADMCLLGEPTEGKVVLGHFGALWLRIRTHGDFIHTAFSEGRRDRNSIVRMHELMRAVLEWIPTWEDDPSNGYRGVHAIVNIGAIEGGFGWRVSRTPHHTDIFLDVRVPPAKPMSVARREVLGFVRSLTERFPDYGVEGEVYVTAPGSEIEEDHELVQAIDAAHEEVFAEAPTRDVTRWFSDASALTRYGVPTVNYGTSTGLMDVELGENLEIEGLVKMAQTYALVAQRVCG